MKLPLPKQAKPTLGYPSKRAAVAAMMKRGMKPKEMAEAMDTTVKNVWHLMHDVRRGHDGLGQASHHIVRRPNTIPVLEKLYPHAEKRKCTVDELALRLLETLADDDIVDAVLDDRI